jgi:hypothetical protein
MKESHSLVNQITYTLPSLEQKFVVDLVNGIDVSRDHIKVQKDRDGLLSRLWDGFTGDAARKQSQINDLVADGLDSCLKWLNDLTESITLSKNALIQVNDGLGIVKRDLATVANYSADTRQQLNRFEEIVDQKFNSLEQMIREVDTRQRAYQQMDWLFNSWQAGVFTQLSLAQRCFLVVSELGWGVFADYCRIASVSDRNQMLQDLYNRLIIQLKLDSGLNRNDRVDSAVWVGDKLSNEFLIDDYQMAVSYLGNHLHPEKNGFNWFVVNGGSERPSNVPYIMDSTRLVSGITNELIVNGEFYVN